MKSILHLNNRVLTRVYRGFVAANVVVALAIMVTAVVWLHHYYQTSKIVAPWPVPDWSVWVGSVLVVLAILIVPCAFLIIRREARRAKRERRLRREINRRHKAWLSKLPDPLPKYKPVAGLWLTRWLYRRWEDCKRIIDGFRAWSPDPPKQQLGWWGRMWRYDPPRMEQKGMKPPKAVMPWGPDWNHTTTELFTYTPADPRDTRDLDPEYDLAAALRERRTNELVDA